MQFNHLQANLSEIYAALQSKKGGEDLSLIATSSSTVYYDQCLVGKIIQAYTRVWQWIQPDSPSFPVNHALELIITTLFDHAVHAAYDARQRRVWNCMRQIDRIWQETLQSKDFKQQKDRYAHHLDLELKGSVEKSHAIYLADFDVRSMQLQSDQEEMAHRHTIINFHHATDFFWSLFTQNTEHHVLLRQPLMPLLKPSSTLADLPLFQALEKEKSWIQLEGIVQQVIPIALIAQLDGVHPLTSTENRLFKRWVEALNCHQDSISPKLFSTVLHEIMSVVQLQGSSTLTFPKFLICLEKEGCELLWQEDPEHMDWRENLSSGSKIECNGTELILGKQLSPEKAVDDRFKIFQCENYPHYVVKIANNPFLLFLEAEKAKNEEEHCLFHLVQTANDLSKDDTEKVSGLDNQGRCVVLEKLFSPFSDIKWLSNAYTLTAEDEKCALVFANHLYCMFQWNIMPLGLLFTHLMWDAEGVLKSTRLLKKSDLNYNTLESHCVQAAKGNRYVLNFLMHVSQLYKHPVGKYYREAVEHTLKKGKMYLIGHPLPFGHRQECYDQHVKKLCVETNELKENYLKRVVAHLRGQHRYSYKNGAQVQKSVAEKLLHFYQMSPTPGQFSSDVEQQIIDSFDFKKTPSLPLNSSVQLKYYQEMHALMMKYNQ